MSPARRALGALLAAVLALEACAPRDDRVPGAVAGDEVFIQDFAFAPETLEVAAGTLVRWRNLDPRPHTVTSGVPANPDGRFDRPMPEGGPSFEFRFEAPGIVFYFCRIHPSMRGSVVVR